MTDVAFNASTNLDFSAREYLLDDDCEVTTLNKKQKQVFKNGIETLNLQDEARDRLLKPTPVKSFSPITSMLVVVAACLLPTARAWPNATVVELPTKFTQEALNELDDTFSKVKPLSLIHI